MTTRRQIESNRRNAEKSTGPRTPEGRRAASQNAVKHGLLAQTPVISGEAQDEYDSFAEELRADLNPVGMREELLVDRVIALEWRSRRMLQVETGVFDDQLHRAESRHWHGEMLRHVKTTRPLDYLREELEPTTEITNPDAHAAAAARAEAATERRNATTPLVGRVFGEAERTFSAVARYGAQISRELRQAYHDLERLQRARRGEHVAPPVAVDVSVDGAERLRSNEVSDG